MARQSKPWFRASKNTWYITLNGRKRSLGVQGETNEKEAITAWHRLMGGMPLETSQKPQQTPPTPRADIASLTAEALDLANGIAMLSEHKCAHLGKSRIVFLSPEAVAILRERVALHPEGLLFPGEDGQKMTPRAVGCRLRRLCVKAGVKHCESEGASGCSRQGSLEAQRTANGNQQSFFPEKQVQHPASSNVRPWPSAVVQDVL